MLALACASVAALTSWQCAPAPLSPTEREDLKRHELELEACKAEGRAARSFDAYDACVKRRGLRPEAGVP
jgi:hypothetical protein